MARIKVTNDFWLSDLLDRTAVIVIILGIIAICLSGCASPKDNEFIIGREIIGPLGWYEFCQKNPGECK